MANQPPAGRYRALVASLDGLARVLEQFQAGLAAFRATMGVHSKLEEEALDTTQKKFESTSKGLEPLAPSMRLVAALEQAYLAETRHLQQAAESSKQKLALVEATANPPYASRPQ